MAAFDKRTYQFEGFILDATRRILRGDDRELELRPKSFDVLCCLVEHAGEVVTKEHIISTVWPGLAVTDESLTRCVSDIRLSLGDRQCIVKTIPRRGYLFASPTSLLTAGRVERPASGTLPASVGEADGELAPANA